MSTPPDPKHANAQRLLARHFRKGSGPKRGKRVIAGGTGGRLGKTVRRLLFSSALSMGFLTADTGLSDGAAAQPDFSGNTAPQVIQVDPDKKGIKGEIDAKFRAAGINLGDLWSPAATAELPKARQNIPLPADADLSKLFHDMEMLVYRGKHQDLADRIDSGWPLKVEGTGQVRTLAHTAAQKGDILTLRMLERAGMDLNVKGPLDRTPIFDAVSGERPKTVSWLVSQGVSMDQFDTLGYPPLIAAWNWRGFKVVEFANKHGFEINPKTAKGTHLIDLISDQKQRDKMKKWGAKSPLDETIAKVGFSLPDLAKVLNAPLEQPYDLGSTWRQKDFDHIPTLPKLRGTHAESDVTLVVAEYAHRNPSPDHIRNTSRVSRNTIDALTRGHGADAKPTLLALHEDLTDDADASAMMKIMLQHPGIKDGSVIFSRSMGNIFVSQESFQRSHQVDGRWTGKFAERDFWEDLAPVIYNSVGNDHDDGDRWLDATDMLLGPRTVLVGGVEWDTRAKRWVMEDYSENDPVFVTQMPERWGNSYSGTSFNAPGGAAIHATLKKRYPTLDPEEIVFAMAMTASRNIRHEGSESTFRPNGNGFASSRRAGFGVVQADKADAVAAEIALLKHEAGDAELINTRVSIAPDSGKAYSNQSQPSFRHYYEIEAPQDMVLTNITLDIYQEKGEHRGGATLLINKDLKLISMKHSSDSQARSDAVMGQVVRKGDKLTIITPAPLAEGAFIALRGQRADSAIGLIAENPRARAARDSHRTVTAEEVRRLTADLKARKALLLKSGVSHEGKLGM
ncbi:MAG: hypothetical protein Alpg2KO_06090 [Alphaproteobacteria bacterium]